MVKIDRLIFGYRKIKILDDSLEKATSIFVRAGIDAEASSDGIVVVRERDYERVIALLRGTAEFESSETLGLYGALKKIKHKRAIAISSVTMLCFLYFLSNLVWDIRVSGNETVTDAKIIYELSKNGFNIGSFWPACNRSKIETRNSFKK